MKLVVNGGSKRYNTTQLFMKNIQILITKTIHTLYGIDYTPDISVAPKPELGEYCTNVFPLAKMLSKAPNIIAEEI